MSVTVCVSVFVELVVRSSYTEATHPACLSHNEDHFEKQTSRFRRVGNGGLSFKRTVEFLKKLPGYKVAVTCSAPASNVTIDGCFV